jgi:hypothetical protein
MSLSTRLHQTFPGGQSQRARCLACGADAAAPQKLLRAPRRPSKTTRSRSAKRSQFGIRLSCEGDIVVGVPPEGGAPTKPQQAETPGARDGLDRLHAHPRPVQLAFPPECATKAGGERSKASQRLNQGASWNNDSGNCRAANRNNNLGVRLARVRRRGDVPTEPTALPVPVPGPDKILSPGQQTKGSEM